MTEKPKLGPPNPIYEPVGFPVFYEQSDDEDIEELGRVGQMKIDARKAAGTWPDESDRSEIGLKRLGRAHRQVNEFAENVFYKPVGDWLRAHPQYPVHCVDTEDRGRVVTLDFQTDEGRQAFVKDFPKWDRLKGRPKQWYDGVPTTAARYDLPDEDDEE